MIRRSDYTRHTGHEGPRRVTATPQSTNVADHARKCAEIMVPPLSAFSHKSIARVLLHDWLEVMCPIEDPRR